MSRIFKSRGNESHTDLADKLCVSVDAVKLYIRKINQALGTSSFKKKDIYNHIKNEMESRIIYFGYIYYLENNEEMIIVKNDAAIRPSFLLTGNNNIIDTSSLDYIPEEDRKNGISIQHIVSRYMNTVLNCSDFNYEPEIQIYDYKDNFRKLPYRLFKVRLKRKIELPDGSGLEYIQKKIVTYLWNRKSNKCNSEPPYINECIMQNRIEKSGGNTILYGVDCLIFCFKKDSDSGNDSVLKNENLRLFTIRRKERYPGRSGKSIEFDGFEYVKGSIRYFENEYESAIREIKEESGINPEDLIYLETLNDDWNTVDVTDREKQYTHIKVKCLLFYFKGDIDDYPITSDSKHIEYKFMPFNEAKHRFMNFSLIRAYAPAFLDMFNKKISFVMEKVQKHLNYNYNRFSISQVFQITQHCGFNCPICHGLTNNKFSQDINTIKNDVIFPLKEYGVKRITITGGEPLSDKKKTFEVLKYIHELKIHNSLSTSGIGLTEDDLKELNNFTDHILLPVRAFQIEDIEKEFGCKKEKAEEYQKSLYCILENIHKTDIILEISIVIHQKNHNLVRVLVKTIKERIMSGISESACRETALKNIIIRLEQYYQMDAGGRNADLKKEYVIADDIFNNTANKIRKKYADQFRKISVSCCRDRVKSQDVFIGPEGNLYNTNENRYTEITRLSSYMGKLENNKPWKNYKSCVRNWIW